MSINRTPVAIRFFILFMVLSTPLALLGGMFLGVSGLVGGLVIADLFLIWAAVRSEAGLIRAIGKAQAPSAGLRATLEQVHKQVIRRERGSQTPLPRLIVFADPLPDAISVRGLTSNGSILLSTGLLSQLDEEELRQVFKASLLCLEETEWMFYTLCSFLAVLTFKLAPRGWVDLFFSSQGRVGEKKLGPFSALRFAMVLPLARFFLRLCRKAPLAIDQQGNQAGAWHSAMHKIRISACRSGKVACPGAFKLMLSQLDSHEREGSPFLALLS